jgi:hypothetical protein
LHILKIRRGYSKTPNAGENPKKNFFDGKYANFSMGREKKFSIFADFSTGIVF